MGGIEDRIGRERRSGETVTVGSVSVTPRSEAIVVRWPWGGWVWNRPVAVVTRRGKREERIPIVDVTRLAQVSLFAVSVAFAALGLGMWIMERSGTDE